MRTKEIKISQSELAQKAGIVPYDLGRQEQEEATHSMEMAANIAGV
jgi:DNA-binding XRE family transcriptional regulator